MQNVLLTGAGGYIGSVLVPKLIAKGCKVRAVDRYFFGADKLTPHEKLGVVKEDSRRLTAAHFENIDYVIDLVAVSNDPVVSFFPKLPGR